MIEAGSGHAKVCPILFVTSGSELSLTEGTLRRRFMIQFNKDMCGDVDAALRREWLEANGIGGFASSTIIGLNTRRYHSLLVAATKPPVGRMVLLSKIEETLIAGGRRYELSCNRYPDAIHPQGYLYLKEFRQEPFPTFVYEVDGIVV